MPWGGDSSLGRDEVPAADAAGGVGFLAAMAGATGGGILLLLGDEARRGNERAAQTARGVEADGGA